MRDPPRRNRQLRLDPQANLQSADLAEVFLGQVTPTKSGFFVGKK